jgi:hypothetical protein
MHRGKTHKRYRGGALLDLAKKVGGLVANEAQETAFKQLEDPAKQDYAAGIIANSAWDDATKVRVIAALRTVATKAEQIVNYRIRGATATGGTRRSRRRL